MNIGELFITLGIKDAEKSVGELTNVKKGMGDLASTSLEAKAAILAAMYALERLLSTSATAGQNLKNFEAITGTSAKTLQQYQYAARQVGVSNEEVASSFMSTFKVMAAMRAHEGVPKGLARVSGLVGFDPNQAIKQGKIDLKYVYEKLAQYGRTEKDTAFKSMVLGSFGLTEGMQAAATRDAFRPEILKKAPGYNEKEINQLSKADTAWKNLGAQIQMAVGHLNAAHGLQLVEDISKITDSLLKMADALIVISEKFELFKTFGSFLDGIANSLKLITELSDKIGGKKSKKGDILYVPPNKEAVPGFSNSPVGKLIKQAPNALSEMGKDIAGHLGLKPAPAIAPAHHIPLPAFPTSNASTAPAVKLISPPNPITPGAAAPAVQNPVQNSSTQNNNVNLTQHFQADGSDHKQVGDASQKGITRAFSQIPQGGF